MIDHDKDGEPFWVPARDRPENSDPTKQFPTIPKRDAGRVGTRCARPWNPSSQRVPLIDTFRTFSAAPPPVRVLQPRINHLQKLPR